MTVSPLIGDILLRRGGVSSVPIADKKCWRQAWPWAAIPKTVVRWEGNVMMPQVHNHARCQLRRRRLSAYDGGVTFYPPSFGGSKSTPSLSLEARLSNDLCPFGAFGPEQGSSLVRRIADRHEAKRRHFLHDVRQRDDLDDLAMEQRGNLLRRSGPKDEREPSLALYFRIAGFRHAGHLRRCLRPPLARHSPRAQLASVDLRHRRSRRRADDVGLNQKERITVGGRSRPVNDADNAVGTSDVLEVGLFSEMFGQFLCGKERQDVGRTGGCVRNDHTHRPRRMRLRRRSHRENGREGRTRC